MLQFVPALLDYSAPFHLRLLHLSLPFCCFAIPFSYCDLVARSARRSCSRPRQRWRLRPSTRCFLLPFRSFSFSSSASFSFSLSFSLSLSFSFFHLLFPLLRTTSLPPSSSSPPEPLSLLLFPPPLPPCRPSISLIS